MQVVGDPAPRRAAFNLVGDEYFETVGIRLVTGRGFTRADSANTPAVAVVNETIVRRDFAGRNPVGQQLLIDRSEREIVGVAADLGQELGTGPRPAWATDGEIPLVYLPVRQALGRAVSVLNFGERQGLRAVFFTPTTLIVRTEARPLGILPGLRRELRSLDSAMAFTEFETLATRRATQLLPQRMGAELLSALGALTVLLTVIGIFGVVADAASRRRKEIGIRLALGGSGSHVRRLVMRGVLLPVASGLLAGALIALGASRLIGSLLFGVEPAAAATFIVAAALVAGIAAAAAYLPARRASRLNPIDLLRAE